jgi:uncharacterized protein
MIRLQRSQWIILAFPLIIVIGFLLFCAGKQIHDWGINWIWGVFILIFMGWRWLLVKWTKPISAQLDGIIAEINQDFSLSEGNKAIPPEIMEKAKLVLHKQIKASENDAPLWEDWQTFWHRCENLVVDIAHLYHPEVKYPLLNIYIPQAYYLIRNTVDDMDRMMEKLSPVLNQVTIAQGYQGYEVYRKLEPSARKLWQIWNLGQWVINPMAAATKQVSQNSLNKANQELLGNLNQIFCQFALKNLCRQAIALYGETVAPSLEVLENKKNLPPAKTKTLKTILEEAQPLETIEEKPLNLMLVGRTGAGKSSLINTLFQRDQAEVDLLPNTNEIKSYHWLTSTGESLTVYDTPGYEQINQPEVKAKLLSYAEDMDLILLVTPALDPTLQMDLDFLKEIKEEIPEVNIITIVTQIDRLRPIKEWNPPYNWPQGKAKKEISIREAIKYRQESFSKYCDIILPIVNYEEKNNRQSFGDDLLATTLVNQLKPSKKGRLARFLRNQEVKISTAGNIIEQYGKQMTTTVGLTNLLKSPILRFISTLTTGSPSLAYLLAEQIPIEQLPFVIGRLQIAYELSALLNPDKFDLLSLWSILLENNDPSEENAWAFGHSLVEYFTQNLTVDQLRERFKFYLKQKTLENN